LFLIDVCESFQDKSVWIDVLFSTNDELMNAEKSDTEFIIAHFRTCAIHLVFFSPGLLKSASCLLEIALSSSGEPSDRKLMPVGTLLPTSKDYFLNMQADRQSNLDTIRQNIIAHFQTTDAFDAAVNLVVQTWPLESDPDAMYQEGVQYESGSSRITDEVKARQWYEAAAERGNPSAMTALGHFHAKGKGGLPPSDAAAARLHRAAAEAGCPRAQRNLGIFYHEGRGGMPADDVAAARWFFAAAEAGDIVAQFNLGCFYHHGMGGLSQSEAKAAHWYRAAAEKGDPRAACGLAALCANGRGGVARDDADAARRLAAAAAAGVAEAQHNLGVFFECGRGGLSRNDEQAAHWYRLAAAQGDPGGMANLGLFHECGRGGVELDPARAQELYRAAAALGNVFARSRRHAQPPA
jgi:TPR repeat protein